MRLTKKLIKTNKKTLIIMLSLSALPATIAFFMLSAILFPFSDDAIYRTTALVEQQYTYGIYSGDKQVACFRNIGKNLTMENPAETGDSSAVTTVMTAGCWIRNISVIPSDRGRILIPDANTNTDSIVHSMNKNIHSVLQKEIENQRKTLQRLSDISSELDYYLSIHNVRDDGFNTIAEYSGQVNSKKRNTEKLIKILEKAVNEKNINIKYIATYKLITNTEGQKTQYTACKKTDEEYTHGFISIQTEDGKIPSEAKAVYIDRIVISGADSSDCIKAAGICGIGTAGFVPPSDKTMISEGHMINSSAHDMPALLVPDGSPVFSKHGYFLGISKNGSIADVRKKKKKTDISIQ